MDSLGSKPEFHLHIDLASTEILQPTKSSNSQTPTSFQKLKTPHHHFPIHIKFFIIVAMLKKCKFKFEIAKLWREFQQRQRNIRKSPQRKSEKRRFSFYVFADEKNWALLTMYFWKISKKKFGRKHFLANQTHRSFGSHHFAPLC